MHSESREGLPHHHQGSQWYREECRLSAYFLNRIDDLFRPYQRQDSLHGETNQILPETE